MSEKIDLQQFLQQHKLIIEDFLTKLLPQQTNNSLYEAMRYSVLNNGKRLRPALVYATGQILGTSIDKLHAAAAALELIHCYSLIHDDLPAMDDDDLRRGLPTCHKAFNEATAILTGDALQTMAFEVLSDPELNPVTPQQQISMVMVLAKAAGASGMILGQADDMEAENRVLTLSELTLLHKRKTGALFNAALELSLIASNKANNSSIRDALLDFGNNIGLAFQIQDDILDEISDSVILGKPAGSDRSSGKSTFISLLGLESSQQHATKALQQAKDSLAPFGTSANTLIELSNYMVARDN